MRKLELRTAALVISAALVFGGCNLLNQTKAPDDQAITSAIQAKLFQDSTLKARDIHVESQKGVVTLTGTVDSDLEKTAVEGLARQANGVKQVVDQLAVAPPMSAPMTSPAPAEEVAAKKSAEKVKKAKVRKRVEAAETAGQGAASNAPRASAPVVQQPPATTQPPAPQPVTYTVPAGTAVTVRMIDSIDSKVNQPGQEFAASLSSPVVAGDKVVFPQGSDARVRLVQAQQSGKFKGSAQLAVELISISANGRTYNVESGYYTQQGSSRGKRTAETVGGGAVIGGLIGAIAGGGKGAAIGAGVGAGTGAGVQAISGANQVKIPSETKIDFTLKAPVTVTLNP